MCFQTLARFAITASAPINFKCLPSGKRIQPTPSQLPKLTNSPNKFDW